MLEVKKDVKDDETTLKDMRNVHMKWRLSYQYFQ